MTDDKEIQAINAAGFQGISAKGSVTQGSTKLEKRTSASVVSVALNAYKQTLIQLAC